MAQAVVIPITAARRAPTPSHVVDLAEVRRVALLRRLWADHEQDGSIAR